MTIGSGISIRKFIGTALTSSSTKVMLLGSGELGKELAIEAHKLGIEVVAVDRYDNAPAMHVAHRRYVINMLNGNAIKDVARREKPDVIIPEIEAINTEALMELEDEGYVVIPNANAVKLCMNRIELREFIARRLELPTTRYVIARSADDVINACDKIGYPCIIKPEMSSSGHGHIVIRSAVPDSELRRAYEYAIMHSRGSSKNVIVEEFINLDTEFTVLTYRHLLPSNEVVTRTLEPIEHWRYGQFHYIESWQPSDKPPELLKVARDYATKVVDALGGLGIYGVELFLAKDGRVLVSEVAPRPHDTGLVTLVTQDINEFAIHLRAALGLPIPRVNLISAGASHAVYTELDNVWGPKFFGVYEALNIEGIELRIFGKPYTYSGRRMAVVLARGATASEARSKAQYVAKLIKIFS